MFGGRLPNRECLNFESSGCAVVSGEVAAHSFLRGCSTAAQSVISTPVAWVKSRTFPKDLGNGELRILIYDLRIIRLQPAYAKTGELQISGLCRVLDRQ